MTKRLDPEIKALRAINRALKPLTPQQVQRSLEWQLAQLYGKTWFYLPGLPRVPSNTEASPKEGDDAAA